MQKSHEKAATDQAKAAAELSIKAIQAVSASNARIGWIAVYAACYSLETVVRMDYNGLTPWHPNRELQPDR